MPSVFRDPFVAAGLVPAATAPVLALDPALAADVPPDEREPAREQAWARVLTVDGDGARFAADPARFDGWLGLLVLDGFALRDDDAGTRSSELLGPGDVVPPWAMRGDPRKPGARASLRGLGTVRVALLDRDFAARIRPWPQLGGALLDRAVSRSILRAVQRDLRTSPAPDHDRVWRLILHAAARWGAPVEDGLRLPRPLFGQRMLGAVLGLSPAATTAAIARLQEDGLLLREPAGSWLVRGAT